MFRILLRFVLGRERDYFLGLMPDRSYSIAEVSDLSGLTLNTVRDLTRRTDLIPLVDYFVRRRTVRNSLGLLSRRNRRFTERGLARIIGRNYRWFKHPALKGSLKADFGLADIQPDWNLIAGIKSPEERRMVIQNFLGRFALAYPQSGGCALPSCRCICHELGVPRADLVAELIFPKRKR